MARSGFARGLNPFVQNIASMLSNKFIQDARKEEEKEQMANLLKSFQQAQGRIGELQTGTDPEDVTFQESGQTLDPAGVGADLSQLATILQPAQAPAPQVGVNQTVDVNAPGETNHERIKRSRMARIQAQRNAQQGGEITARTNAGALIDPKANENIPGAPARPTDYGDLNTIPGDYELGDILSQQDRYQRGQAETNKFVTDNLFNENVDPQKLNTIAKILQSQTEGMKPVAPKIVERDPAKTYIAIDKNGKEKVVQQGTPKTKESKVGSYTGADGYQYTTYKNADGTIETIKSENKVQNVTGGKEAAKKAKAEKLNQTKYNTIMGSPFMKIDDLLTQGLITEEEVDALTKLTPEGEVEGYKQGGAYVVRNKDGSPKLIFTNKLLENYAKNQIPGAPNKWTRLKKDKKEQAKSKAVDTKTDDNDPLGLR